MRQEMAGRRAATRAGATGDHFVSIGYQSSELSATAANFVHIGYQAGNACTTNGTVAIGYRTLWKGGGLGSVAVGNSCGDAVTTGVLTAVGNFSFSTVTTGTSNVGLGLYAGYLATGSSNVMIGHGAGDAVTTASSCTYIGRFDGTAHATTSNVLALSTGTTVRFLFDGTNYFLSSLPTTNPAADGALWNNSGVLSVSAG